MEDEGPQPLPRLEEDRLTRSPRKEQQREQQGEKRAAPPSTPTVCGPDKGRNARKSRLKSHSKCLMEAGVEVKFSKEGWGGGLRGRGLGVLDQRENW